MGSGNTVVNALSTVGIKLFGIGMPVMSPSWADFMPTTSTSNDEKMSLNLADGHTWLAPLAGTLLRIESAAIGVTLVSADGAPVTGPGMLLTIFPQLYLRLSRLFAQVLETSPGGSPLRPVPRFFFYAGAVDLSDVSGDVTPQHEIGQAGDLTIYDSNGFPIDPLAAASAFQAIMTKHNILQKRALRDAFVSDSQVNQIANLAGTASVRVRLSEHNGAHYDGSHLSGISAAAATSGLFKLESGLGGTIKKDTGTGTSGTFPDKERRLLLLGLATTGRLGDQFKPPASLPSGVTLARDFFSIRIVKLKTYLLGAPNQLDDGVKVEKQADVRIHEPLDLLTDGNDVLAAGESALLGTPTESLAVGQTIKDFDVPDQTGVNAHWPGFPSSPTTPVPPGEALPLNLRDGFLPEAAYFDDGAGATANVDVVLTINGLPPDASVRVYPRKFIEDAQEARGDGAGRIVPSSGTITLLLKDPLALRTRGISEAATIIPSPATLRFDLMVVKRTGQARLYGNVSTVIPTAPTATFTPSPSSVGINTFAHAPHQGVTNAGILGLGSTSMPSGSLLDVILALTGEGNPRSASRLPTMARRDLLLAALSSGNWTAVLAAGRLAEETHSADTRLGAPGGLGGRETQVVGVSTQNGRLAYDIAQMAFRRTTNIADRLIGLADEKWKLPAEPAEVSAGSAATASSGTFAGAVLQTIAPFCETPELNALKDIVDLATLPATFNDLVQFLVDHVPEVPLKSEIVDKLNSLKNDSSLTEPKRERLFDELHREIISSAFGRRDAQWALEGAISNARRFIYIESPAFAATSKDYGTDPVKAYAVDLIAKIRDRMAVASGLHVIICTPKYPDFAAGYEPLAAHEADDRRKRILGRPSSGPTVPAVPEMPQPRTVSFHPVGFPGRASRLESTVVIVDDVFALVGSSTFRRRGLTFDGGSDLVFTDTDLVEGRSPAISNFRRSLMATRMGTPKTANGDFGSMPHADFVRLADGIEAFHVVREKLVAGGLGKIERLWNGRTPWVTPIEPTSVSIDLANPDGREFDLTSAFIATYLQSLSISVSV